MQRCNNLILTPDTSRTCEGYSLDLQTSQTSVGGFSWFPSTVTPSNSPNPSVPVLGPMTVVATYTTSIAGPTCVFQDSVFLDIDSACCDVPGADFKLVGESSCNLVSPALANCNPCSGLTLHIADTFFVDCNLELVGCTLAMDTNAVIWVDSSINFSLQNSWVYGSCGEMWDGIYVTDSSSLVQVLFGSRLEDAKQALVSRRNGNFRIESSEFLNNWVSLRVEDGLQGQPHPGRVADSDFKSRPGDMLPPLAGRWADAGIYLRSVASLEVGGGNPLLGNRFDSLACGILSYTSNLVLRNNEFRNIQVPAPTGSPFVISAGHGKAVASIGLSGGNQPLTYTLQVGTGVGDGNRFFDCPSAVWVLYNQNIALLGNRFERIGSNGLRFRQCYQDEVRVEGNTFVDVRTSVRGLLSTGAQIDILDNSITNTAGYSGESIVLMDINTLGAPQPGGSNVEGNAIRTFGTGIFCNAVGKLVIKDNQITVLGRTVPNGYGAGIKLDGLAGALVRENALFFEPDPMVLYPSGTPFVGIWVEMSDLVDLRCNETADWYEHIRMDGPLQQAYIRGNTFYDRSVGAVGPQVGMRFRTGTTIGQQGSSSSPSGNQWLKANPNSPFTFNEHWVCGQGDRFMMDLDSSGIGTAIPTFWLSNLALTNPFHPDLINCGTSGFLGAVGPASGSFSSLECEIINGGEDDTKLFWEQLHNDQEQLSTMTMEQIILLTQRFVLLSSLGTEGLDIEMMKHIPLDSLKQNQIKELVNRESDICLGKSIGEISSEDDIFPLKILSTIGSLFEGRTLIESNYSELKEELMEFSGNLGRGSFQYRTLETLENY